MKLNVVILHNMVDYSRSRIVEDLKNEGYRHTFGFIDDGCDDDNPQFYSMINVADEIWIFGNNENNPFYKMARDLGKDIWIMG